VIRAGMILPFSWMKSLRTSMSLVDLLHAFGGEAAELLALEQIIAALAFLPSFFLPNLPVGRGMSVSFRCWF
jgi:hypothetical protein